MTDARFPERWLMDRRVQRLTAEQYRAFSMSLMYSVSNRTDGHLTMDDLEAVPHFNVESIQTLVSSELWAEADHGWVISDYLTTQTSRAQLESAEHARVKDAERKARERATKKGAVFVQEPEACSPVDSPADNSSEVSYPADNPADGIGKARDRPRTGKVLPPSSNEEAEIAIDPVYPTDPKAVAWRQKIDAAGIRSMDQLAQDPQLTREQARKMWLAAFPHSMAA